MFRMVIGGTSLHDLKSKLFQAARALEGGMPEEAVDQAPIKTATDFSEEGDEGDDTGPVMTDYKITTQPPMPMVPTEQGFVGVDQAAPGADRTVTMQSGVQPGKTTAVSGDRDARGLPWDERIHAGVKTKNKDGTWRNKKGVDKDVLAQVEAELQARYGTKAPVAQQSAPAPQVQAPQIAAPPAPMTAPVIQQAPAPLDVPAPMAPPAIPNFAPQAPVQQAAPAPVFTAPGAAVAQAPVVQTIAPATPSYENIPVPQQAQKPAHSLETFRANLISVFVQLLAAGKINQEYIERLKAYFGVKEAWDVAKDEAKSQEMFDQFVQHGLITKVG